MKPHLIFLCKLMYFEGSVSQRVLVNFCKLPIADAFVAELLSSLQPASRRKPEGERK